LRALLGADAVLSEPDELLVYECDALTQHRQRPRAVVFPHNTAEVAEVLRLLQRERVPFAPRGAGTGLSGGALTESVVIEMARMRRLLKLDVENRRAMVETGLVNAQLTRAAAPFNLHYVPDPSSQMTCTIGGNIAENAGGIHCLKYGMTVDHVIAARVVLAGGEIADLYAGGAEADGYDLLGVFVGSEGTFGIATEATLRLTPVAPAVRTLLADFADVDDGSRAVSAIIAAGLMPSALEMMDGAAIRAVEQSVFAAGLPPDAAAALLIELDGIEAGLDEEAAQAESICRDNKARSVRLARDEQERGKFWAARKGAFGAMGRLAPDLMLQDAVVPRSRLPEVLAEIYRIGIKYGLLVANVFHAGDGNLHPYICYDSRQPGEVRRVKEAGREMMEACVRAGGTITGEHGVGLDKSDYLPLIFSTDDMDAMLRVRAAFDPTGLCNPGKIIPTSRSCGEARGAMTRRGDAEGERRGKAATRESGDKAEPSSVLSDNSDEAMDAIDASQQLAAFPRRRFPASPGVAPQSPTVFTRSPFNTDAAHKALARIVGAQHVTASPRLSVVASPSCVAVSPADAVEACEILRLAADEGWTIVPAGAGTWLNAGQPLASPGCIVLETNRMRRILEHEPADLVASAEAGLTLAGFNNELRRAGQCLPLDPPDDGRATLGGVAATGMAGAHAFGYGAPRSFVIGMRVALAGGRLIKAGGRVVKNVAGYDLCKLFVGSRGTLCLILELTFKLRPLPVEQITVVASGPLSSLWRGARALMDAQLFPVAIEMLNARAAADIHAPIEDESEGALLIRFAGASVSVRFQREQAAALLARERGIKQTLVLADDEPLWQALASLPLRLRGDELIWRIHVPPAALGAILATEKSKHLAPFPSISRWHAGVGDGRLRVIGSLPMETSAGVEMLSGWRKLAEQAGGWMIIESAPGEIKEAFDARGSGGAGARVMRRIKRQLDGSNTFGAGRFVAGS
jgi:glycolate oxidase subunit GlcD